MAWEIFTCKPNQSDGTIKHAFKFNDADLMLDWLKRKGWHSTICRYSCRSEGFATVEWYGRDVLRFFRRKVS